MEGPCSITVFHGDLVVDPAEGPCSRTVLHDDLVVDLVKDLDPLEDYAEHLSAVVPSAVVLDHQAQASTTIGCYYPTSPKSSSPASHPPPTTPSSVHTSTLQNLSWTVDFDSFEWETPFGKKSFSNIIAAKDIRASKRVILAAHYDSKYFAPPNDVFLGATDSAFPCAVLLDLAETLDPC